MPNDKNGYNNKSRYRDIKDNKEVRNSGNSSDENGKDSRQENDNLFIGRNAVLELLKSGRDIDKLFLQKGEREGSITLIAAMALEKRIPVIEVDKRKLDAMAYGEVHQGVAAIASETAYASIDDMLALARERGQKPFIIICDSINDPHNLGAIIRSAECAGAHGIIIPKRRSVSVNGTVAKAAAGAVFHIPIARVPNLTAAIKTLKDNNIWVWALEADGTPYYETDFDCGCAFVLGGENSGVTRLVRDNCDFVVSIPMFGKINSLNVSNAGAVVMFEAAKQRNKNKK